MFKYNITQPVASSLPPFPCTSSSNIVDLSISFSSILWFDVSESYRLLLWETALSVHGVGANVPLLMAQELHVLFYVLCITVCIMCYLL